MEYWYIPIMISYDLIELVFVRGVGGIVNVGVACSTIAM